ncbi:MAG: carbohydrate ABC transporter permease [Propionibacteriaceae bacterium]|jgi:multiple sugar transport system permease protein|nr:carbohydrate ABC transporter permease [Propionibacteriaceae bacterium]
MTTLTTPTRSMDSTGPSSTTPSTPPAVAKSTPDPARHGGVPHKTTHPSPARRVGRIAVYIVLIGFAAFLLLPFFWMISSSLKKNLDVFSIPIRWIPEVFQWRNYADIWTQADMGTWMVNTVILSVVVTALQVLTGSFAAYGFARVRFPGRDVLFLAYIATLAVPWQAYMIPQFILMTKIQLTGKWLWPMIVLQAFGAFGVFLMKQFFETIPEELSESARLDGLTEYGIWWRIMLPLSGPALASLALLTFVRTWNDYMGPLIYLRDQANYTLQIGLKTFQADPNASSLDALLFTGSTLSVLPIAIIFLLGQRFFIEGIATSGMKG